MYEAGESGEEEWPLSVWTDEWRPLCYIWGPIPIDPKTQQEADERIGECPSCAYPSELVGRLLYAGFACCRWVCSHKDGCGTSWTVFEVHA